MQRLIKNSRSPPVHKAQARAAFCLLCHFPNRPRLELPLHRLCSSTALFPSSLSRCKGPPRTVFRLSWFTRPIWGERREFQWNIDAALLHLVFDTQGDLSTHEYKHNALMFLFFPSKRRRKKSERIFFSGLTSFFSSCFPPASYYSISLTGLPSYFSDHYSQEDSEAKQVEQKRQFMQSPKARLQSRMWQRNHLLGLFGKNSEQSFLDSNPHLHWSYLRIQFNNLSDVNLCC